MMLIHPAADVPIIQLSVLASESPAAHLLMGRALATLRDSNIAVLGSGFASFHNLGIMRSAAMRDPAFRRRNTQWSSAVTKAMSEPDDDKRDKDLEGWRSWPNAYEMHPRGGAEHFLPLLVGAGAGGGPAKSYTDEFLGLDMYSYYWE